MITPDEIQSIKQRFGIVGNAQMLNHAIQVAAQVAPTDMSVLITGESGSGKESFSKIIHSLSARKHGTFIVVNCGAIPEGTIDSELFGHEKGSFTGATEARKGYFEVTDGGTIFLDEIGEMPLGTQARLLRVLETGDFIRVGSSKVQKTDVRVVAATNVNLTDAVQKGRFREDLYYRLSTVPIYVPPLRERGPDVALLFRKFATDFAERYRIKPIYLTEAAGEVLSQYAFPGNIRQLRNLVEQMSVLQVDQREIDADTLRSYLPDLAQSRLPALLPDSAQNQEFTERELLYKVLFEMRQDLTELKKLVFRVLQDGSYGGPDVLKEHADLFNGVQQSANYQESRLNALMLGEPASQQEEEIEDIPHEPEEESLRLEEKEREMIVKALRRNNNKRKYAAQDLGISERTLYRKIKQYELEDA